MKRPDPIRIAATNAAVRIMDIRPSGCDLISTMTDAIEEEVRFLLPEPLVDEMYPDA